MAAQETAPTSFMVASNNDQHRCRFKTERYARCNSDPSLSPLPIGTGGTVGNRCVYAEHAAKSVRACKAFRSLGASARSRPGEIPDSRHRLLLPWQLSLSLPSARAADETAPINKKKKKSGGRDVSIDAVRIRTISIGLLIIRSRFVHRRTRVTRDWCHRD